MCKYLLFILLYFLTGLNTSGQNPFADLMKKYKGEDQFFASELGKNSMSLYLKKKTPDKELREVIENVDKLKVLSFSIKKNEQIPLFMNDIYSRYNLEAYQPLKVLKGKNENKLIFIKEKGNYVTDLLLVTTNPIKISVVEIQGNLNLDKMALLNNAFHIDELNTLSDIDLKKNTKQIPSKKNNEKLSGEKMAVSSSSTKNITVLDKKGNELICTEETPHLFINGYNSPKDFQASLQNINPECVKSISVIKQTESKKMGYPNGVIELQLRGNTNELFTICDGVLYFGQNGYMQAVSIDDECGPFLLIDCKKKPLSEILHLQAIKIKSIELTTDPRNCQGKLDGEFVVLESK